MFNVLMQFPSLQVFSNMDFDLSKRSALKLSVKIFTGNEAESEVSCIFKRLYYLGENELWHQSKEQQMPTLLY